MSKDGHIQHYTMEEKLLAEEASGIRRPPGGERADVTGMGEVELKWLSAPSAYTEEKPSKGDRLPMPLGWVPRGKNILVFQDPEEDRRGRILIPEQYRGKYRATEGRIVVIGDGYDGDEPEWEGWKEAFPYEIGQKVAWGRYEDRVVKLPVEDGWWDTPEEKEREREIVAFTLIPVKDIWLVK